MWRIRETTLKTNNNKVLVCGICIRSFKTILINRKLPLLFKCSTYLHEAIHRFTTEQFDKIVDLFDITTILLTKRLLKNE